METSLRLATTNNFLAQGLFISLLSSTILAIIYYIICSCFQNKVNYILSFFLLALTSLIFSSQLVHYQFFRTFYSFYSAGNASQVFEFWQDIWILTMQNFVWILLFFLPTILMVGLGKRLLSFNTLDKLYKILLILSIVLIYVIGLAAIYGNGKEHNSAYDLYYKNCDPVLSTEKLGMITTMRLDLQRVLTGWSPALDPPDFPVSNPDHTDKDNKIDKEIDYNIMDIDFKDFIVKENNKVIEEMHNYFANVEPTSKNESTEKYEGYNLILIIAESFSPYAVHEDITPTLYKMLHKGYNFTNFYVPSWDVSTSDGEYVTLTSLLPKSGVWSFTESVNIDLPFVMGNQLKKLDYKTVAYHNHTYTYYNRDLSHPNMGYNYTGVGNGLEVENVWPASDLEMMEKTIPEYIDNEPFHAYYLTVSGHMQYSFTGNSMAFKNKKYVENLPYSEEGQAYLATQVELDKALEHLLYQLDEADVANKTLIALCTDHYPYGLDDKTIDELAGHKIERNFGLYKSSFILYTKDMEPVTIHKPSSNLDIIPTLSNLLGLEYDSRLLMGKDIFSDSEPLVIFRNKSFITDKGKYNSLTKEFIPNEDADITEDYLKWVLSIVESKFYYSAKILETDYYNKIK